MKGLKFLSDLVFNRTYAKTLESGRKEIWEETVNRCFDFLEKNYEDQLTDWWFSRTFGTTRRLVLEKKILPSMRLLQFAGEAVHRENARLYNCSGMIIKEPRDFAELCYLSMCGCGVGLSIPATICYNVGGEASASTFVIEDSKEGWADAFHFAIVNPYGQFDASLVRPKGSPISTGGTASGAEELLNSLVKIQAIVLNAYHSEQDVVVLNPHEIADIGCHILSCVLVGGTRRSAGIAIMSEDFAHNYKPKDGNWQEVNPQRYLMNISMFDSDKLDADYINDLKDALITGEPGKVKYKQGDGWLCNPCGEISGEDKFFCNLTTVNVQKVVASVEQDIEWALQEAIYCATFLGTLQAGFTNFHYLYSAWGRNARTDALLGVSMTGIQQCYEPLLKGFEKVRSRDVFSSLEEVNEKTAKMIGINPAKRITCVKPEGTASALLGTSSGIHSLDSEFFIRHVMLEKTHPIIQYMEGHPSLSKWVEQSVYSTTLKVVKIPCHLTGLEPLEPLELVKRAIKIQDIWIKPNHIEGKYTNSVSLTVSIPKDYDKIDETLLLTKELGNVTVLQSSTETYPQAPFTWLTRKEFEVLDKEFSEDIKEFNWDDVNYLGVADERKYDSACAGGVCQIL